MNSWIKLGNDIDGESPLDESGSSVSLSSDGNTVAIGAMDNRYSLGHVRVYGLNGSSWVQLGGDIDGEAYNDESGRSVSLSSDGNIVAISAPWNDDNGLYSGHVRVHKYSTPGIVGGSWIQLGFDIDGAAAGDLSGWSVSLSSNGSRVAIGAINNYGNDFHSGHVRIYEYSTPGIVGGIWNKIGDIGGEAAGDESGYSVSLSSDGTIVAIGAPDNDVNGNDSGHVRVYEYSTLGIVGGIWNQLGLDIDGAAAGDQSGYSVSLSSDGNIVAIGAPKNNSGNVRVYEYSTPGSVGGTWDMIGDIPGEATNDQSGHSVSLSSDGSTVAIGARKNSGANGSLSGHVRVYNSGSSGASGDPHVKDIIGGTYDLPKDQNTYNLITHDNFKVNIKNTLRGSGCWIKYVYIENENNSVIFDIDTLKCVDYDYPMQINQLNLKETSVPKQFNVEQVGAKTIKVTIDKYVVLLNSETRGVLLKQSPRLTQENSSGLLVRTNVEDCLRMNLFD